MKDTAEATPPQLQNRPHDIGATDTGASTTYAIKFTGTDRDGHTDADTDTERHRHNSHPRLPLSHQQLSQHGRQAARLVGGWVVGGGHACIRKQVSK